MIWNADRRIGALVRKVPAQADPENGAPTDREVGARSCFGFRAQGTGAWNCRWASVRRQGWWTANWASMRPQGQAMALTVATHLVPWLRSAHGDCRTAVARE